jgi:hypothetical protein
MTIATNSDIQTLSDAELAILLDDILNEQERRAALANTASRSRCSRFDTLASAETRKP